MAHRRIYAFDYGRGLAIFGMLLAHTFEKGICDLNSKVELDYLKRVPVWLIACLSPFALLFMMGLFFTFITSMACTMSVINIEKHGRGAVMAYLFYRLVFGFVLKAVELVVTTWWDQYGVFATMSIEVPKTEITTFSHTLDSISFCGFLVPLVVYVFRVLPYFKEDWHRQVTGMTVLGVVLLMAYSYISNFCTWIGDWAGKYHFNLLMTLMYKIATGPFMISQSFPFGLIGGCIAIIMLYQTSWKSLRIYATVIASVAVATAVFFLVMTDDLVGAFGKSQIPCFVRFLDLGVETVITVWWSHYSDDPSYPVIKRYKYNRFTTFLRRIGCVSLSCFIFEKWVSNQLMKWFFVFFGKPYDLESATGLWSLWTVAAFMVINFAIDLVIIRLWEKVDFCFSCERLIGAIMSWLFGRTEKVDWHANNNKIIYGPLKALEEEIMTKGTEKDRDELKKIIGDKKFDKLASMDVETGGPAPHQQVEESQQIEMRGTVEKEPNQA